MLTRILLALALGGLLVLGAPFDTSAADKDSLVIALDTLGAQVMDPIMDTRAPHAHYHAPVWDSLVGFDLDNGGIGPGVAERWEQAADGKSWTFYLRKGSASTTAPRADRPRRAGLRARRIDPRPDHEPPQGSSGAAGAQLSPGGAQPGHRALHRSSHRGHVPRPHRGARRNRTPLPKPAPSIPHT